MTLKFIEINILLQGIIVVEIVLIIILTVAFVKMFVQLKALPKDETPNQVDKTLEEELNNH